MSGQVERRVDEVLANHRSAQINKRLGTLRSQVQEASAAEAALLDQLDAVEDKRRELDAKVAALDAQVSAAQRELDAATA